MIVSMNEDEKIILTLPVTLDTKVRTIKQRWERIREHYLKSKNEYKLITLFLKDLEDILNNKEE